METCHLFRADDNPRALLAWPKKIPFSPEEQMAARHVRRDNHLTNFSAITDVVWGALDRGELALASAANGSDPGNDEKLKGWCQ